MKFSKTFYVNIIFILYTPPDIVPQIIGYTQSIKQIFNSGLFWAVGAAEEKNPNCHKYATFEVSFFLCFQGYHVFRAKKY